MVREEDLAQLTTGECLHVMCEHVYMHVCVHACVVVL